MKRNIFLGIALIAFLAIAVYTFMKEPDTEVGTSTNPADIKSVPTSSGTVEKTDSAGSQPGDTVSQPSNSTSQPATPGTSIEKQPIGGPHNLPPGGPRDRYEPIATDKKVPQPSSSDEKVSPTPEPRGWKETFQRDFLSKNTIMKSVTIKETGEAQVKVNGEDVKVFTANITATSYQGQVASHTAYIDSQGQIVQPDAPPSAASSQTPNKGPSQALLGVGEDEINPPKRD